MDSQKSDGLYPQLAGKFGFAQSKYLPDIIRKLASPEQAQIMLQLTATNEEIAERLNMDRAKVEQTMQELFEKGVVFPVKKGWRLGRMIDSLHDMTLTNLKFWDSCGGTEYADLWRKFEREEWFPAIAALGIKRDIPVMRTIPAWQAVADNPSLMPEEDIRAIFKSVGTLIAVPCPCRRRHECLRSEVCRPLRVPGVQVQSQKDGRGYYSAERPLKQRRDVAPTFRSAGAGLKARATSQIRTLP